MKILSLRRRAFREYKTSSRNKVGFLFLFLLLSCFRLKPNSDAYN